MADKPRTQQVKTKVALTYTGGAARAGDTIALPAQTPRERAHIEHLVSLKVIEVVKEQASAEEHPRRRRKS